MLFCEVNALFKIMTLAESQVKQNASVTIQQDLCFWFILGFLLPGSEIGEEFVFKELNQANSQYWELIHSNLVYIVKFTEHCVFQRDHSETDVRFNKYPSPYQATVSVLKKKKECHASAHFSFTWPRSKKCYIQSQKDIKKLQVIKSKLLNYFSQTRG